MNQGRVAIEVCSKRGVHKTSVTDILDYKEGSYDTLLLMMNGTGIFQRLEYTQSYLKHLKELLNDNGQILVDSSDISFMYEEEDGSYWRDASRDYYGEVTFQIKYKNQISEAFDWLYLDFDSLEKESLQVGLKCEKILEGSHYEYLARLTKL